MLNSKAFLSVLKWLPYFVLFFFIIDIFTFRITDHFLVGTIHGNVGFDFYSVPRSFINLRQGKSIFDSYYANWYGPYATPYFYHPAVSVFIGSWLSLLKAKVAFAVFVICIAAMMLYAGKQWSRYFDDELQRHAVVILTACSLPVYLLMWNAQMHIFTIISVVLILTAVIDILNGREAKKKLFAGLLISLLTKPIILLWLPALLLVKETRGVTIKALLIYIAISAVFLLVPFLNPEGDNYIHWKNILSQSAIIRKDKEYFSFATTFPLHWNSKNPYLLVPVLLCAASLLLLFIKDQKQRLTAMLYLFLCLLASYYFAYTLVWEYQYTTLMAAIPCLLWLYNKEKNKELLKYVLIAGLLLYLPTTYVLLKPVDEIRMGIMQLCKVLPVTVMLIMMMIIACRWFKIALVSYRLNRYK